MQCIMSSTCAGRALYQGEGQRCAGALLLPSAQVAGRHLPPHQHEPESAFSLHDEQYPAFYPKRHTTRLSAFARRTRR